MPDDPKEIDVKSFTPKQRREYLAYRLLGSPNEAIAGSVSKITGKSLAGELGVSEATICEDLKSDEAMIATREAMTRFIKGQILPTALKKIYKRTLEDETGDYSLQVAREFKDLVFELQQRNLVINVLFGGFQDRLVIALADRMIESGASFNGNGNDNGNGKGNGSEADCRQLIVYHPPDASTPNPDLESGDMG